MTAANVAANNMSASLQSRQGVSVSQCLQLPAQYWASCNYWFGFPESKVPTSPILIPPFSLEICVIFKWDAAAQQQQNPSFNKPIPTRGQTARIKAKSFTFYQPVVVIAPLSRRPGAVWTDTVRISAWTGLSFIVCSIQSESLTKSIPESKKLEFLEDFEGTRSVIHAVS